MTNIDKKQLDTYLNDARQSGRREMREEIVRFLDSKKSKCAFCKEVSDFDNLVAILRRMK